MKPLSKFTFVIAFLCSINIAFGQEISDVRWVSRDTTVGTVQVVAYWKKGEQKKFRAYKRDKRYKGDSLTSEKKIMDCIVEFSVTDSTADSYDLTFKIVENKLASSGVGDSDIARLNIRDEDLTLHYTTDANGTFESFKNRAEVEGKLEALMNIIRQKNKAAFKANNEAEQRVFTTVLDMTANGRILFSRMYETFIAQFHGVHGYRTGINDTLNFQEAIPHPLMKKPIQFDCYLYVAALDTLGMAQFDAEKFGDMEQFAKDYAAFLKKTREESGLQADKKQEDQMANLNMEMDTFSTIVMDLDSGWPKYLKLSRATTAKGNKEEETITKYEIWELDSDLEDR
jgi:hypothetical protein